MRAAVGEYAEDLKRQLARALAENSQRTQQLDRSFPRRLLSTPEHADLDDERIRNKYAEQNSLRQELASIGLIRDEPDLPLPQQELAPWQQNVLWNYLLDTDQKLQTFEAILAKVTLFREVVNRRFLNKVISVTADDGLTITRTIDNKTISAESLSSGEQHELILIYNLLFNVEPNSTVLIDEPEISLHVAWQQGFIADIVSIAELASLRFIIATHSPQIINKWWEYTVELGPSAEL